MTFKIVLGVNFSPQTQNSPNQKPTKLFAEINGLNGHLSEKRQTEYRNKN